MFTATKDLMLPATVTAPTVSTGGYDPEPSDGDHGAVLVLGIHSEVR
jgi:hypothetical protein